MIKKIIRYILPVAFLGAGIMFASTMMKDPKIADRQEISERVTPVAVMLAELSSAPVKISAYGNVTPAKQVVIIPQVGGQVISVNSNLVIGGTMNKGSHMLKIDPRDYEFAQESARERIANAEFGLKMERGQQAVAKEEWQMLGDSITATAEGKELALRIPQIEKAEASLKAAKTALKSTELNLSRTVIKAPFNCLVQMENIEVGQVVSPQSQVARLIGTDEYWIQVSVPMEYLSKIKFPTASEKGSLVDVFATSGIADNVQQGRVVKLLGDLDPAGRMARIIISVYDPLLLKDKREEKPLPLLLGAYVKVEIHCGDMENVIELPRNTLRDVADAVAGEGLSTAWVWVMDSGNRLQPREVEIGWRTEESVIVTAGLTVDERIVTSTIATPISGMKLIISEDN
jgi:RND family efflux transporter MFP subunit